MAIKKAQVSIYLTFIIFAIIIITLTVLIAPFGVLFNTEMYSIGEEFILEANDTLSQIDNASVRNTLSTTFGESLGATQTNIEVNNAAFKYGWLLILALGGMILFLYTRRMVEVGGGIA